MNLHPYIRQKEVFAKGTLIAGQGKGRNKPDSRRPAKIAKTHGEKKRGRFPFTFNSLATRENNWNARVGECWLTDRSQSELDDKGGKGGKIPQNRGNDCLFWKKRTVKG